MNDFVVPVLVTFVMVSAGLGFYDTFRQVCRQEDSRQTEESLEALEKTFQSSLFENDKNLVPVTIVLPDGSVLKLAHYPKSIRNSIERHGSEGTVSLLAANMLSLAQQLNERRKLTASQYLSLQNLAIQGHHLAEIQGMIQKVADDAQGDRERFQKARLTVGSYENRTPMELSALIGRSEKLPALTATNVKEPSASTEPLPENLRQTFLAYDGGTDSKNQASHPANDPGIAIGHEMRLYLQLARDAQENGALKDPAIRAVVDSMARNIYRISNDFATASHQLQENKETAPFPPGLMQDYISSRADQMDSMDICHQGGLKETSVYCPKRSKS